MLASYLNSDHRNCRDLTAAFCFCAVGGRRRAGGDAGERRRPHSRLQSSSLQSNALTGAFPTLQVLLLGRAAHLLAATLFAATPAGTVAVPELQRLRSPLEEEYGRGAAHIHTSSLGLAPSGTAVVSSPRELPAEQAAAWAAAVLQALRPAAVVIATTMMVSARAGASNRSGAARAFAGGALASAAAPHLPTHQRANVGCFFCLFVGRRRPSTAAPTPLRMRTWYFACEPPRRSPPPACRSSPRAPWSAAWRPPRCSGASSPACRLWR